MPGVGWRDERSSSDPLDELPVLSGLQIVVVLAHVLGLAQHGVAGAGEVVAVLVLEVDLPVASRQSPVEWWG